MPEDCNGCCKDNVPMQAPVPVRAPPSVPICCPDRSACASAAPAVVTNPLLNTIRLRFRGFRRISASNALDHPERREIYELIKQNPGIDLTNISRTSGMNIHTLRYHLDILTARGKIIVMKDWGIFRYYENHGTYTEIERKIIPYTRNPVSESILDIIRNNPGCTQTALSEKIGITGPTVRWYMKRLALDGIVQASREGRCTRHELTSEALSAIAHLGEFFSENQPELDGTSSG
jgi:predicted transcriptional regulator